MAVAKASAATVKHVRQAAGHAFDAALSTALAVAHLVLAVVDQADPDAGAGDLDGDARGASEDDAASVAPEGMGLGVVDVRALTADEERLRQAADRSPRQRGRHG